jgi:hypothetical protein
MYGTTLSTLEMANWSHNRLLNNHLVWKKEGVNLKFFLPHPLSIQSELYTKKSTSGLQYQPFVDKAES